MADAIRMLAYCGLLRFLSTLTVTWQHLLNKWRLNATRYNTGLLWLLRRIFWHCMHPASCASR